MTGLHILASFAAGMLGAMGFGGGGILILYLTLVLQTPQLQAQGMNLVFFLPTAATALILHKKSRLLHLRRILPILISALPGAAIGLYCTTKFESIVFSKLFGALLILMGLRELFSKKEKDNAKNKSF